MTPNNRQRWLTTIIGAVAAAGILGAVGVYAQQGRLDERTTALEGEVESNGTAIDQVGKRVTNVQVNIEKIGDAIDRMDKRDGGPGVRLEAREP